LKGDQLFPELCEINMPLPSVPANKAAPTRCSARTARLDKPAFFSCQVSPWSTDINTPLPEFETKSVSPAPAKLLKNPFFGKPPVRICQLAPWSAERNTLPSVPRKIRGP
jgi:hypothetical protein